MRPYVSVDIETTGIDDKSHILQIAAVYDDLKSPIDKLLTFNTIIKYDVMTHCEPYAIGMNAELFKKLMTEGTGVTPRHSCINFLAFLNNVHLKSNGFTEDRNYEFLDLINNKKDQKLIFAGKNISSFDLPKLKNHINEYNNDSLKSFNKIVHYKTLDVGSLYYDVFGDNVSLSQINKLTGRKEVSHDALDDALDVVYAIRYKLKIPHGGINE